MTGPLRRLIRPTFERAVRIRRLKKEQARPSFVEAASRDGQRVGRPLRALLRDLERHLGPRPAPRVAVLVGPGPSRIGGIVATARPRARLTVLRAGQGESVLHAGLAAAGPFDVVVDDTRSRRGSVERFQSAFFHLKPRGVMIVRQPQRPYGPRSTKAGKDVWQFVSGLVDSRAHRRRSPRGRLRKDRAHLADSIRRVALEERHLVVQSRARSLAKMREHEMDAVLEARSGRSGRVLDRRPPLEFESRCTLRETSDQRSPRMHETYQVPAVSLREYHDVICAPGQIAVQGNLVLPDSFRHNQYSRLWNRFVEDAGPRFAQVPKGLGRLETISGPLFYLDSEWPSHFGHAMTEQMSRLWAWPRAKEEFPELRAVLALGEGMTGPSEFERGIFGAVGIPASDLVVIDGPTHVERLLAATPMLSMPNYIHPDLAATWNTVGRALAGSVPEREWPRRIFCSRRIQKRACSNAAEVEDLFASHGFAVICPEDYAFAEQARIFREAEVVAGFAGSAMFSLCFCESPKQVIVISSESYSARNEYMIASVRGHRLDLVWSKPDPRPPEAQVSVHRSNVGFTFDHEREGKHLNGILSSL